MKKKQKQKKKQKKREKIRIWSLHSVHYLLMCLKIAECVANNVEYQVIFSTKNSKKK